MLLLVHIYAPVYEEGMHSKAKEGVTLFANGEEEQEEVRIEAMAKYSWGAQPPTHSFAWGMSSECWCDVYIFVKPWIMLNLVFFLFSCDLQLVAHLNYTICHYTNQLWADIEFVLRNSSIIPSSLYVVPWMIWICYYCGAQIICLALRVPIIAKEPQKLSFCRSIYRHVRFSVIPLLWTLYLYRPSSSFLPFVALAPLWTLVRWAHSRKTREIADAAVSHSGSSA